jgi:endonuclease I
MMKKNLHYLLLMLVVLIGIDVTAAVPSGYYNNAKNKSDKALMMELHKIIKGHTKRSYQQLWTDFGSTDCNGSIIIDRYANTQFTYNTDRCGNYNGVGDCYNREHSIPNSWWGGDDTDTAYTDLHHLFPVDGWVNNERGNYPFGNCSNGSPRGTGKLGYCTFSGYNGMVFEVADEYKGDFARVYFYFATRYMTRMNEFTSGTGSIVFTNSTYLGMTTWAINQMLEWHRNDPVSALETTRNDAVYGIQRNRNPYVDNPELVEYIWGNKKGSIWTGTSGTTATLISPTSGSTVNVGINTGSGVSKAITLQGVNLTKSISISVSGTGFSVTPTVVTASAANSGTTLTITYNGTASSATGTLTINSTEVSATVNLTASYNASGATETIETWEGCTNYGSYSNKTVQGHAFKWYFTDAGIWDDTHRNDDLSCRFGKNATSCIEMKEDVTDGASKVTFYAAKWSSSEDTPTLQVQYSTNGGSTWTTVGSCSPNATWQQYSFTMNVTGTVRFKFLQTAGARFNIDDIAITSNPGTVATPELTAPENGSTVNVGVIAADGNQVAKTISLKGNNLTKLLSVRVTGTGFSVTPTSVPAAAANAGISLTVVYTSTTPGEATGTLTISSTEVNTSVNLIASKLAMPSITISSLDVIEVEQNLDSPIVSGVVSAENNDEDIILSVDNGFQLSLNRVNWSNQLTLDPSGEVFYVRLASTSQIGMFEGTVSAVTSLASAYADVTAQVVGRVGDVNMDGLVDIDDITKLISYILGETVSPFSQLAANINNDESIDIEDVTVLIGIVLGNNSKSCMTSWTAVPMAGGIHVDNNSGQLLEIYDFDADCVETITEAGVHEVKLPAGIYMVTSDTKSVKVVVK